ncbi:hypothetical protein [Flavobacterium sp.]|uniref:hypothetical protein n=1 Tax=Flavobacterium sp. TaxID=239 RepID=UPI003D10BADB
MFIKEFSIKLFLAGMAFYLLNMLYVLSSGSEMNLVFHGVHFFFLFCFVLGGAVMAFLLENKKDIVGVGFLVVITNISIFTYILNKWLVQKQFVFSKWNFFILFLGYLIGLTFLVGKKLNKTQF